MNSAFISNMHEIYGDAGKAWLINLPTQLARLSEKWQIRFLEPLPELSYNFVGLAEIISTGEIAVLKLSPEKTRIASEARWLQCFSQGVPALYKHDDEEQALLMERLSPGHSLKDLVVEGKDDAATRTICEVIRDLEARQQKLFAFKHLSELAADLRVLEGHLDNKLLSKAQSLFRELTSDRTQDVILHGDLHHYNVLASGGRWKAIDPHGYMGDPVFEVGPMIYNPCYHFPNQNQPAQTIERRLKILAEELPFDAQRIRAWAFCMTVLSLAWTFESHAKLPDFEIQIASIIDRLRI